MIEDGFALSFHHFADIVALSVGRVLENNKKKGSTYSYETLCTIIQVQIDRHFGMEPEQFFSEKLENNNFFDFSFETVKLFENFGNVNKKEISKIDYKEMCKEVFSELTFLMSKYHIDVINDDDYFNHWFADDENPSKQR